MRLRRLAATGLAVGAAVLLAACSSSGSSSSGSASSNQAVTLTLSGWSLSTTPEFQTLATAFHKEHPSITIDIKEYDSTNYDTLMTADLAAGKAPDIITMKNVDHVATYAQGGALLDVSDVKLPSGIGGANSYVIDGKSYAVPYRQDSWVLFYNKDLFDKAKVAYPDGSWTWADYMNAAAKLEAGLKAAGSSATAAYQHTWQSTTQGLANAQSAGAAGGANILSGNYAYMQPYYQDVLKLQSEGAQPSFNTATADKLTYQAEFGKQQAAMMIMGTWEVASQLSQEQAGTADTFNWGIAPVPQLTSATAGTSNTPVTFGDPTGFAINAKIDSSKVAAAKEFLTFAASEDAAKDLAAIGDTPALTDAAVTSAFFATKGIPTDSLSKFAWSTHKTYPENPTSVNTAPVQTLLNTMNTSILSGSSSFSSALSTAESDFKSQIGS